MTENTKELQLRCSFCTRTQHEVKKLIAGWAGAICDECVAACVDIVNGKAIDAIQGDPPDAARRQQEELAARETRNRETGALLKVLALRRYSAERLRVDIKKVTDELEARGVPQADIDAAVATPLAS